MTNYKVSSLGYDIPLISLNNIVPQPRTEGLQYTRRTFGASGVVRDQAPYIEFLFTGMVESDYLALITQFGLSSSVNSNGVTIYIANDDLNTWTRYNGKAMRPEIGKDGSRRNFFVRDIVMLVKNLELSE